MRNKDILVVMILFYIGWFGSVFLAQTPFSDFSVLFPILLIGFLYFRNGLTKRSIIGASIISVVGILFDFTLIRFGFIAVAGFASFLIPTWLLSIWLLFSFSMMKLAKFFSLPIWMASALGLVMGPLSYKSGEYFQVLTFSSSATLLIYAAFWAVIFPLTLHLAKRST